MQRCAKIVTRSSYGEYAAVHQFLEAFFCRERYSSRFSERLHLAMKEAFVNAVRHGNRGVEDLSVGLSLSASAASLVASITDCGCGFDLEAIPDPRNHAQLSGRGIFIIRSIAEIIGLERTSRSFTMLLRSTPY
ncbi:MAG: ATP-binding protein [Chlorobiaceae bacterium]